MVNNGDVKARPISCARRAFIMKVSTGPAPIEGYSMR
jgi:hypothetical protein